MTIDECNSTISKVQDLLEQNTEWKQRYANYAEILNNQQYLDEIRKKKKNFHEWAPIYLYMTVSEAKRRMLFSLRYLGQDVAKLKVGSRNQDITISTAGFEEKNERDFGCVVKFDNCEWRSGKASDFRQHFFGHPERKENSRKKNEEHRLESLLLTEFTKKIGAEKLIRHIQPVKLAGHARFQMPTPLSASNMKKLKYSNSKGGGIDIISRIGVGKATKLCIMEIKDAYESPTKVIQQGLAYAKFVRELLRSDSGEKWWKIFGFKGKPPSKIDFYVVCVMPSSSNNDTSIAGQILKAANDSDDTFNLHHMYFEEKDNVLTSIITSLNQCRVT